MNISDLLKQASRLDVHQVSFFPIIRAYMQRLGLVELINQMIGGQMKIKPGLIVAGMIQDTLCGRTPLYHLEQFFEDQDIELMLGESVPVCVFADHNVGRVLDRIAEIGASKIFGEIARRAAIIFDLDTRCGHWDSTSVSLWGEYDESFPENTLKITYGYSKDHRPDLKQFMLGMLCVEHNIPILGETHDGNSSDKTLNNKLLTRISNELGEGAFTYVADSAMVTEANLACFDPIPGAAPLYFVTRLPHTYGQADQAIHEAVSKNDWQPIGVLSRSHSLPKRLCASYKAFETTVEIHHRRFRAIVIHSSAHDKRRQKRIDKEIENSRKDLSDILSKRGKNSFFCQLVAEAECAALRSLSTPLHALEPRVEEQIIYAAGRPIKDGLRSIAKRRWRVLAEYGCSRNRSNRFNWPISRPLALPRISLHLAYRLPFRKNPPDDASKGCGMWAKGIAPVSFYRKQVFPEALDILEGLRGNLLRDAVPPVGSPHRSLTCVISNDLDVIRDAGFDIDRQRNTHTKHFAYRIGANRRN